MGTRKQQHRYLLGDRSDRHQIEYGRFVGHPLGDSAIQRGTFVKGFGEVAEALSEIVHEFTVIDQQLGIRN
jgi:hypothetical protein